jgi:hypothetical protein
MKHLNITFAACISALVLGCAADPGTKPHDMSEAQHEAMANQEERADREINALRRQRRVLDLRLESDGAARR